MDRLVACVPSCLCIFCRSKLNGRIFFFAGRFFRVFDRGQNNCYFDSAVKNTNMPQKKFLQHPLVLTGTIPLCLSNRICNEYFIFHISALYVHTVHSRGNITPLAVYIHSTQNILNIEYSKN